MERAWRVQTKEEMKATSEAAARDRACIGGDEVKEVTSVSDPVQVRDGLWLIGVRVLMLDGTVRLFRCDATASDVFSVREVPNG
jgi:hypothetical protein